MKFVCYCSSNFNFVFLKITPKAQRYFWELSDDMPNIVFRVPEGLLFGCMEFGWVVGWVTGPKFSPCGGLSWVGLDKLDPRTTLRCLAVFEHVR